MKALVLLANGTEEMEAVITCDILARAGFAVVKAAVESSGNVVLICAHGTKIIADVNLEAEMSKLDDFSVIVLPGGSKGADTFCSDSNVQKALKHFAKNPHQYVAAICAAPLALREAEIFPGARVTCYPSLEGNLTRGGFFVHDTSSDTIHDDRLITSRGPGTAIDFALNIVKILKGESIRDKVASSLLLN